jgi:hypothetical protein
LLRIVRPKDRDRFQQFITEKVEPERQSGSTKSGSTMTLLFRFSSVVSFHRPKNAQFATRGTRPSTDRKMRNSQLVVPGRPVVDMSAGVP